MNSSRSAEPRRRRSSAELRGLVLAAAEDVFGRYGYRGATMEQVAGAAGVTRSVVTRHFPTKADLFDAVATGPLADFARAWAERWSSFPETPAPGAAVHAFVADLVRMTWSHRPAIRLLLLTPEGHPGGRRTSASLDSGLADVTAIAAAELERLGYPGEHAATTIRAVVSMVVGYACLDEAVLPDAIRDPDELAHHLARLIRFGLALERPAG